VAPSDERLHLWAEDAEDVTVMSAMLQDAVVTVGDATYRRGARIFALVANRFRWEARARERVRCGVHFRGVLGVQTRGLDRRQPRRALNLLAVGCESAGPDRWAVTLEFAGGASIRLTTECIDAELRDLGPPWRARRAPEHPLD
jgi:hypothetical protein